MKVITLLHGHGLKLTPQRRAILNVIADSSDHLTPSEIYERVRAVYPTIGLVTVYRTLDVLTDLNLICRVHGERDCHSYFMRHDNGHHHHVVCTSCGAVADFTKCDIEGLERKISRQTGFEIRGHLLEFEGLCRECVAEKRISRIEGRELPEQA